jgi:hypothetical protein
MKVQGIVEAVFETQVFDSGFQKREFVLQVNETPEYPQYIKLEIIKDKVALLDDVDLGQQLSVEFNLNGRKWVNQKGETMYFNTLQAWRIDKGERQEAGLSQPVETDWMKENEDGDELPF